MLSSVVATDGGRHGTPGVADSQGVRVAVTDVGAVEISVGSSGIGGIGDWGSQHHRVKINPQLADIRVSLAEGVGAGVRVRAGGVGADDGVGVVGTRSVSTSDGEHTAHPKGGGAGPGGGAALGRALRGGVAGAIISAGGTPDIVLIHRM